METVLTILMALGIYAVAPLLAAIAACGITVYAATRRAKRAEPTAAREPAHEPAKA